MNKKKLIKLSFNFQISSFRSFFIWGQNFNANSVKFFETEPFRF